MWLHCGQNEVTELQGIDWSVILFTEHHQAAHASFKPLAIPKPVRLSRVAAPVSGAEFLRDRPRAGGAVTKVRWAEKNVSYERINSIRKKLKFWLV